MAEDAIEAKLASGGLRPVGSYTEDNLVVDFPVVLGVLFKHVQLIELFQSKDFFQVLKTPLVPEKFGTGGAFDMRGKIISRS